ncbi:hypothetical protein SCLCIDRAFT_506632 [Scleroderma citrinum Foug A]|uniref:BHLH domain-containing protein n=1 Tax=Scleroderma citrinum Foug A TaxID=1036808 RepID=A0A0C3EBR1_9AGAM|nr:hypothetical protein SCLCIDRAFT_506632 [Scleroderma citrinum Foug A]
MDQQQHQHQQQQQQQQQQHIPDDHNQNLGGTNPYGYYPTEQEPSYIAYNHQLQQPSYPVVQHPGPHPRGCSSSRVSYSPEPHVDLIMGSCTLYAGHLSAPDLHQGLQFHNLSLMSTHQYPAPVYTSSPQHVSMTLPAGSPPPPSPHMYDPLSPPISGSDTSADGIYHHSRNSSGTGSPSSSRGTSLVHRTSLRYNPTPSPTTSSSGRRGRGRSLNDSDDDDMGATYVENLAHSRKEATRRQRIEAEQRRRDELRDGYAKLKDVLPVSNQKSSKVSLLERGEHIFPVDWQSRIRADMTAACAPATNHIIYLEKTTQEMQARLLVLEQEVQRLRAVNEKISLGVTNTPSPGTVTGGATNNGGNAMHGIDSRPLSPPPEPGMPPHSLAHVQGQEPPREDSRSPVSERY